MDNIFSILNSNQTSVGEEYLYLTLRKMNFNFSELKEFDDLVEYFNKNKEAKVDILCILHGLGKCRHNYIYSYIYNINDKRLKNIKIFYVLRVLPFISILAYFYNPVGILLIILSCSLNMYIYYKYKFNFEMSLDSIRYISRLVSCAENLSHLKYNDFTLSTQIGECLKPLKKLINLGNSIANKAGVQLEEIIDYFKIITMWDFINYNKIVNILALHTKEFQILYEIVGKLDTAISVQLFRESLNFYCKPSFYNKNHIIVKNLYHPLIEEPVYNSLDWDKNIILTGSNASGKSTFIKALAINIICSQTIFTCFCNEFSSKMSFVITSMAVKDSLTANESYFIAEIKSLKRILNNINENVRCLCFIDEILKGTNTIERISASSAILNWLYYKNCLTMVAYHDIELTEILKDKYINFHFREQILDNGIYFDYKIYKGASQTTNAISLLKYLDFDEEIIKNANQICSKFKENKEWQKIE